MLKERVGVNGVDLHQKHKWWGFLDALQERKEKPVPQLESDHELENTESNITK